MKKGFKQLCLVAVLTMTTVLSCATTNMTASTINNNIEYGDNILISHKTHGQLEVKFASVNSDYLFFWHEGENPLYSSLGGKVKMKNVDSVELISRYEVVESSSPYDGSKTLEEKQWRVVRGVAGFVVLIVLIPLMLFL